MYNIYMHIKNHRREHIHQKALTSSVKSPDPLGRLGTPEKQRSQIGGAWYSWKNISGRTA